MTGCLRLRLGSLRLLSVHDLTATTFSSVSRTGMCRIRKCLFLVAGCGLEPIICADNIAKWLKCPEGEPRFSLLWVMLEREGAKASQSHLHCEPLNVASLAS